MKNNETTNASRIEEIEDFLNKQRDTLLVSQQRVIKFLTTELEKSHKFSIALIIALGISVPLNLLTWLWMVFFFILTNRFVDAMLTLASTVGRLPYTLDITKGKQWITQ